MDYPCYSWTIYLRVVEACSKNYRSRSERLPCWSKYSALYNYTWGRPWMTNLLVRKLKVASFKLMRNVLIKPKNLWGLTQIKWQVREPLILGYVYEDVWRTAIPCGTPWSVTFVEISCTSDKAMWFAFRVVWCHSLGLASFFDGIQAFFKVGHVDCQV